MSVKSLKQYVKYAAPMLSIAVIVLSVVSAPLLNQSKVEAAALKTVAQCRAQYGGGHLNEQYVSCVNNDTYEAMVYRAYRGVLGRYPEADKAGFNYWVGVAKSSSNSTLTTTSKLMSTAEYKAKPYAPASYNQVKWVSELYQRSLDRKASVDEAYYWAAKMQAGKGQTPLTRAQVAASVIQSVEAKNAPGSVINAPCFVTHDACPDQ